MIHFQELVNALKAHPDIWLARAQILSGASADSIKRAEDRLGAPLHPEIKEFYTNHNGVAIEWMFKHSDRFNISDYKVNTSELPFWMDLMQLYSPPFDGQIIVAPIGEVFINSYDDIEECSDFAPSIAWIEYIEEPTEINLGSYIFGGRKFESEIAFRSQLRFFDAYLRDTGNLMLFEPGKSDPRLIHMEEIWLNFSPEIVMPLSKYIHHVAYDFGLRWNRGSYFKDVPNAPISFDAQTRLAQLITETKFPGDLRE